MKQEFAALFKAFCGGGGEAGDIQERGGWERREWNHSTKRD